MGSATYEELYSFERTYWNNISGWIKDFEEQTLTFIFNGNKMKFKIINF